MRKLLPLLLILLASCAQYSPGMHQSHYINPGHEPITQSHPKGDQYQQLLDQSLYSGLPGVMVAIRDESGDWEGAAGYADLSSGALLQPGMVSRVGSISKTFVAVILFRMEEDGLVQMEDLLSSYLSSSVLKDIPNADKVTLSHLLSHTSGIPNYTEEFDYLLPSLQDTINVSTNATLDYVRGKDALFSPGNDFYYSNTNYILAGLVIEKVLDDSMETALQHYIIEPLGLESTFYQDTPEYLVKGYHDWYGDGRYRETTQSEVGLGTPDGGIMSNTQDLTRFLEAIFTDRSFLSSQSMDRFLQEGFEDSRMEGIPGYVEDMNFGHGIIEVVVDGNTWYGHGGSNYGYRSMILSNLDGSKMFIYLSNANFGSAQPILDELLVDCLELIES